ncbi:hypothetical protein [Streptomyces sp. NPDC001665]
MEGAILQSCSVGTRQIGSTPPKRPWCLVDERYERGSGRSISAARNDTAAFKISFARRSSGFSFFNAFS